MQTFLPYPDFDASAAVLDYRRLGKQRVETLQIMKAITTGEGWVNHPATKMWRGHEDWLLAYQRAICNEWTNVRNYKDTCLKKTRILFLDSRTGGLLNGPPTWLGDDAFHAAHRSNLLRKNPKWYGQFGWTEPDNLEYVWPVK